MATGTGERPLGTPAQEKELLGLSGFVGAQYSWAASETKKLVFQSGRNIGVLILNSNLDSKRALYLFGSSSSGAFGASIIKAPTQSGLTVTFGTDEITITNGSSVLNVMVIIMNRNVVPTISNV